MDNTEFLLRKNGAFSPYWNFAFASKMSIIDRNLQVFKYTIVRPEFRLSPDEQLYMYRAEAAYQTFVNWNKGKHTVKAYAPSDSEIEDLKKAGDKLANMFSRTPDKFGEVSFVNIANKVMHKEPRSGRGDKLMEAAKFMRMKAEEIRELVYTLAEQKQELHNSDS